MRVVRGRADTREADREETRDLMDWTGETGEVGIRVWTPGKHVAFGRRDTGRDGYEGAVAAAEKLGFPTVEREVGGRAVAYADSTIAFVRTEPVDDVREGLHTRYERVTGAVQKALWRAGVPAQRGEPDDSFCPGSHSLQYDGKLVGIAQRVRQDAAMTSGVCIVADAREISAVLNEVYPALSLPFDPRTVGSVEQAGGRRSAVLEELERALIIEASPDEDVDVSDAEVQRV